MPTFLYRCPNTGFRVQGYTHEQTSDDDSYEVLTCSMCSRVHLVNPTTGKVMGEDEE
jgi:ribosomal protein S27E